jgi:DNA-binding IclR family transcriptional regulator
MTATLSFDDSLLGAHLSDRMRDIARYLHDSDERTVAEVAEHIGIPYDNACMYLRRLTGHGIAHNPRRGRYKINPEITQTSRE